MSNFYSTLERLDERAADRKLPLEERAEHILTPDPKPLPDGLPPAAAFDFGLGLKIFVSVCNALPILSASPS
jgi:hypothetical protein